MRPLCTVARILTLSLVVLLCLPVPAPAGVKRWETLEVIWEGANFFRRANKTFHNHIKIVKTKQAQAQAYGQVLRAAGHTKLAEAYEQAFLKEAEAMARANVREIRRVRHFGKNLVAFLTGRRRVAYNSARALRVLRLDQQVQDATLDRRLIEARVHRVLEEKDLAETAELATLLKLAGVGQRAGNLTIARRYDLAWITPETQKSLDGVQERMARERAARLAEAAAAASASETESSPGEPPPMVAASDVTPRTETEQPKGPEPGQPAVEEVAGRDDEPEEVAAIFSCDIDTDKLSPTARPKECFALVEARREACFDWCEGDRKCEDDCQTGCEETLMDQCVEGFTCEIEMSTLFGAGDRQECFDKVETRRGACIEDCKRVPECQAACKSACDAVRNEKCLKMQDVFRPKETRDGSDR